MDIRIKPLRPYALAVLITAVAILIRWVLEAPLQGQAPMLLFALAVFLAAHLGGLGPGLLATGLSAFAVSYLFFHPRYNLWVSAPPDQLRLVLFVIVGVLISLLARRLRRLQAGERVHRLKLGAAQEELASVAQFPAENPNPVLRIDDLGHALYTNTAAEQILQSEGWITPEPVPATLREPALSALVSNQQSSFDLVCRNGSVFGFHCVPVSDKGYVNLYARDVTAARKAQAALHDSEQRLRTLFDNAGVGIFEVEGDDCFVAANDRACEILGRSRQELLAMRVHELTWPEDRSTSDQASRELREGRSNRISYEKRYTRGDGTPVWVHLTVAAIRDDAGHWLRSIATIEDISDRRQAEQALREREAQLRQLAETIPQLVWMTRPDGQNFYFNRRWYEYTGTTLAESQGTLWSRVLHPDDYERTLTQWHQCIQTGEPFEIEYRFRRARDGMYRWFLGRGLPVRDEQGNITQWFGTCTDIHEQKQAQEELRKSQQELGQAYELLEGITEGTQDLIAAQDTEYRYIAFNNAYREEFARIFGPQVEVGASMVEALAHLPAEQKNAVELWNRALRGESFSVTQQFGDPGLERKWFDLSFNPIRNVNGEIIGAAHIVRDVTVRLRAEQELAEARGSAERAQTAAEEANAAKDRFLAVLSHELRTPLMPVLASVSMLQKNPFLDDHTHRDLDMMRRNVELEARLIDDLLDLTRIARGKVELNKQTIELCTVINRAAEVCRPDIEARQLHFGIDMGTHAPYIVDADVARLQQVFWNLIKNSIKFTPQGGCIGVRCKLEGDHVVAEVNDSGVGIEPEALPRIFDAFNQADRAITRQFGGLGLGLAISRSLVELHGGTIEAHSSGKGTGATFRVRLPVRAGVAASGCPTGVRSTEPAASPLLRILRILVVEDHGDTAEMVRMMLESEGHEVQTAGDLSTALEKASTGDFDLLISDLGLPDGSGLDLMRQLRSRGFNKPGIALSGYGQENDIEQSRAAGFAAHLIKPIDLDRLIAAISKLWS